MINYNDLNTIRVICIKIRNKGKKLIFLTIHGKWKKMTLNYKHNQKISLKIENKNVFFLICTLLKHVYS